MKFPLSLYQGGASAERSLHERLFLAYEMSYEKCSEVFSRKRFRPLFRVSETSRKFPAKFPIICPCKKNHRQPSAGAQGELFDSGNSRNRHIALFGNCALSGKFKGE